MKLLIILTLLGLSVAYKYNGNKPSQLNCDCGWKNKITEGAEGIETIEYPWFANIVKWSMFWCEATVVTEWHVLTASTCMGLGGSPEAICVGVVDKNTCVKVHEMAKYYKKYRGFLDDTINNLAIVSSKTKFEFNSYVGPACMPHKHIENKKLFDLNQYVKVLAYRGTEVLKDMDVQVVSKEMCKLIFSTFRRSSHLCTFTSGHYTCKNDRGGPVAQLDSVTDRYNLIGIVAYGRFLCGPTLSPNDDPSFSTNVSAFLKWIEKKIEKDKPGTNLCRRN